MAVFIGALALGGVLLTALGVVAFRTLMDRAVSSGGHPGLLMGYTVGILVVGLVMIVGSLGAGARWIRQRRRPHSRKDLPLATGAINPETLRFLLDKRLALLNVRRDYEWKILSGVIGLIGAVDLALVTKPICLNGAILWAWWAMLGMLFIMSFLYEFGVQMLNRIDRLAIEEIYRLLCDSTNIHHESYIRVPIEGPSLRRDFYESPIFQRNYLWVLVGQMSLVFVVCIISAYLPLEACVIKR
jgi:hypothetical protein